MRGRDKIRESSMLQSMDSYFHNRAVESMLGRWGDIKGEFWDSDEVTLSVIGRRVREYKGRWQDGGESPLLKSKKGWYSRGEENWRGQKDTWELTAFCDGLDTGLKVSGGNYCLMNDSWFLVCFDEWMEVPIIEIGRRDGLVLDLLSFRTCEISKRRCQEGSWHPGMGLRGDISEDGTSGNSKLY